MYSLYIIYQLIFIIINYTRPATCRYKWYNVGFRCFEAASFENSRAAQYLNTSDIVLYSVIAYLNTSIRKPVELVSI